MTAIRLRSLNAVVIIGGRPDRCSLRRNATTWHSDCIILRPRYMAVFGGTFHNHNLQTSYILALFCQAELWLCKRRLLVTAITQTSQTKILLSYSLPLPAYSAWSVHPKYAWWTSSTGRTPSRKIPFTTWYIPLWNSVTKPLQLVSLHVSPALLRINSRTSSGTAMRLNSRLFQIQTRLKDGSWKAEWEWGIV